MSDALAQFAHQQYLNLETFRKNGQGVQTPVWFVENQGTLYVRTVDNSFKVRRVRNNPRVRVMPCGVHGEPMGEWVEGQARFASADESKKVNGLLTRKYGLMKVMFELIGKFQGRKYTVIVHNL